jgi:hypothetical protein
MRQLVGVFGKRGAPREQSMSVPGLPNHAGGHLFGSRRRAVGQRGGRWVVGRVQQGHRLAERLCGGDEHGFARQRVGFPGLWRSQPVGRRGLDPLPRRGGRACRQGPGPLRGGSPGEAVVPVPGRGRGLYAVRRHAGRVDQAGRPEV